MVKSSSKIDCVHKNKIKPLNFKGFIASSFSLRFKLLDSFIIDENMSSDLSSSTCHSSKPIKVTLALHKVDQFKLKFMAQILNKWLILLQMNRGNVPSS